MEISNFDEHFKKAVALAIKKNKISIKYMQDELIIGYSRAAKYLDQMEDCGFIEPSEGKAYRKVLITPEQFKEVFGEDFNTL